MVKLKVFCFILLTTYFVACNKSRHYTFVKGKVIEVTSVHRGHGYFKEKVWFEFVFNGQKYSLEKMPNNTVRAGRHYYQKGDSIIVQIPDSTPEDALPNRIIDVKP